MFVCCQEDRFWSDPTTPHTHGMMAFKTVSYGTHSCCNSHY